MPLPSPGRCLQCLREPPPFRRACCTADYAFPWDALIGRFKFGNQVGLADLLARRLSEHITQTQSAIDIDAVLPVPLSPQRLRERGYNQAWELARRVAADLRLRAWPNLLWRPVDTAHQADLPRAQRALNLRGAFMVPPDQRARLQGQRLALVDDVLTTGATAREASLTLLRAGAASVDIWCLARTA